MGRNKVITKLKSRVGASLSLALLLLLIASMTTALVLSSAVSSAKSVRNARDSKQNMLTLQSALLLFRDDILRATVTVKENNTVTVSGCTISNVQEYLKKAVPAARGLSQSEDDLSSSFVIQAGVTARTTFPPVCLTLAMKPYIDDPFSVDFDQSYSISISCSFQNDSGTGGEIMELVLVCDDPASDTLRWRTEK